MVEPVVSVSVIIPTRNRPRLLQRAVASVCRQSFTDFELIVVDDASDKPLDRFTLPEDRRIRLVRQTLGMGACAARNRGLAIARGDLVAFLDDDDEWLPGKLAAQIEVLSNSSAMLVSCAFRVVSDLSGTEIRRADPPFEEDSVCLLQSTPFPTSVPLIRRAALEAVGAFDPQLEGAQDRDLWLRLHALGPFGFTRELGVIKHNHDDQISTRLRTKRAALQYFLTKHHDLFTQHKHAWAHQLTRLGLMQCADEHRLRGTMSLLRSALVFPSGDALGYLKGQLHWRRKAREAQLDRAFRQLDGALRYF